LVESVLTAIETRRGPVDTLLYNAGKGVWGDIQKVTAEDFEEAWRVNALGLFHVAKRVVPGMVTAGRGAIIVTGATASMRGVAATAAFAPAKAAQRALTQSLARHLGPKGVHVAHILVDGVVGGPETRAQFASRPDEAFIDPAAIAETALHLVRQPRSAWSFEVDLRPFNETW
jgi:NADP-dependent 3-hydroxy acid dehydrogenase YdfG